MRQELPLTMFSSLDLVKREGLYEGIHTKN